MTNDLTILSGINSHPMRVAIVEYTAQMSGGFSLTDFSNLPEPMPSQPTGSYLMARHFISLASDAVTLDDTPVAYNASNYYGALILNPDLLGAIQQGSFIGNVNGALATNSVNTAVDQALCFLTAISLLFQHVQSQRRRTTAYLNKTYTGTPVSILKSLLADAYPVWSINGPNDPYWNTAIDNLIGGAGCTYSQIGHWFNGCVANPTYDKSTYQRPNFPAGFEGWVQANNWLIRTFSPSGHVTFGWQDNMWAVAQRLLAPQGSDERRHREHLFDAGIELGCSRTRRARSGAALSAPLMSPTSSCSTAMRRTTAPRPVRPRSTTRDPGTTTSPPSDRSAGTSTTSR